MLTDLPRWRLPFAGALLAAGVAASGAEPTPGRSPCADLANDRERLACYDLAEARRGAGQPPPSVQEASKETFGIRDSTAPAPVTASATAAAGPESIAAVSGSTAPVAVSDAASAPELKSITATVAALRTTPDRKLILELDNGQVWRQVETQQLRLKVGDSVTISRGALGSFNLKGSTSQIMKVRRTK